MLPLCYLYVTSMLGLMLGLLVRFLHITLWSRIGYEFSVLGLAKKRKTIYFSVFLSACKPFEFSVQTHRILRKFDPYLGFKRSAFSLRSKPYCQITQGYCSIMPGYCGIIRLSKISRPVFKNFRKIFGKSEKWCDICTPKELL